MPICGFTSREDGRDRASLPSPTPDSHSALASPGSVLSAGIQRGMEDCEPVFRAEDHVILTTVDDGMIGVVLLGILSIFIVSRFR